MKASKTEHKGETRIKLDFAYNTKVINLVKQIEGAKWSATKSSWLIPYTGKAFSHLKKLFPNLEYPKDNNPKPLKSNLEPTYSKLNNKPIKNLVNIKVIGCNIFIKLKKNEEDLSFLNTFRYSKWDNNSFHWIIPNFHGNLERIKEYFNTRIGEFTIDQTIDFNLKKGETITVKENELQIIKTLTVNGPHKL